MQLVITFLRTFCNYMFYNYKKYNPWGDFSLDSKAV